MDEKNKVEKAPDVSDICEVLSWDSDFFGFNIARVRNEHLSQEQMNHIDKWCAAQQVRCLYLLCGVDDPQTTQAAEDSGFHFVDIRTTFETTMPRPILPNKPRQEFVTRPFNPDDVAHLQAMAGTIYHDTRFFYDRHFPQERSRALYETWIKRSCEGNAEQVIVVDYGETIVGFISCHLKNNAGSIGLIGVADTLQKQGIGEALMVGALAWFNANAAKRVSVVTQGRNYAAQRLFQRCGFLTESVKLWYHKWYVTAT